MHVFCKGIPHNVETTHLGHILEDFLHAAGGQSIRGGVLTARHGTVDSSAGSTVAATLTHRTRAAAACDGEGAGGCLRSTAAARTRGTGRTTTTTALNSKYFNDLHCSIK